MKKIYTLLLSGILLTNLSFAQQDLQKSEVYSKILSTINKYQQISNFSRSDLNSKESYERAFKGMFNADQIVNDLPLPEKNRRTVTSKEYLNLLYDNFPNGLTVQIETGNMDISYDQDENNPAIWRSKVAFIKKLSGMVEDGSFLSLSVKVQLNLVLSDGREFLIAAVSCPVDTDADGFENNIDECPNQPGFMTLTGCPDTDKDGVPDKFDKCPDTPLSAIKIDKDGCERFKFFKDIAYQVNLSPTFNLIAGDMNQLSGDYFSDNKEWGGDSPDKKKPIPLSFSFEFNATKPIMNFKHFTLGIETGLGLYNYKTKINTLRNNTRENDLIKFPAYFNDGVETEIDYEKSKLHYLGVPVGLKLYNNTFFLEAGINNHFFIGGNRKVFLENNKNAIIDKNDLGNDVKRFIIVPYANLGYKHSITKKLGIQLGIKYSYLNKFNDPSNKDMTYSAPFSKKEDIHPFISYIKHEHNDEKMFLQTVSIDFGIIYKLN